MLQEQPDALWLQDGGTFQDVVFVVEDTAAHGVFFAREMMANYVAGIVDKVAGGREVPWASARCASTFTLVLFQASDCLPK